MKLDLVFGSNGLKKSVDWYQPLEAFPKLLMFRGKKWEWAVYSETSPAVWELVFSELPTYDPNFYASEYSVFEDMFEKTNDCCCGAIFSSFPWDHMRMCPKWVKW